MPHTYCQLYFQLVFAVKGRNSLILPHFEQTLYQYITGIMRNKNQKLFAINGMPDHIHILASLTPDCKISDLVREIKKSSNSFINDNNFLKSNFSWQEGYGAFSYSKSSVDSIVKYISNQKEHHKNSTFKEEYLNLLKEFKVEYNEKYLFDWLE